MKRTAWMALLAVTAALAAAACGNNGGDGYGSTASSKAESAQYSADMPMAAPAPPPPPMDMVAAESRAPSGGAIAGVVNVNQQIIQQDQQGGGGGQPAQLIAYTYNYGFKVPPLNMEGLLSAHKTACEQAGPATCYVVNSQIYGLGEEQSSASMTMRATPAWIKNFQGGMQAGLKQFDATLESNSDTAEDLTTTIVDSEARLRSMKTMRDRLQELLRDRPGRLSDLLEIEREFARVQADIDSHESVLAALRLRVSMSVLSLGYQPRQDAVSESVWRPLGDAFGNFVPNMAATLAAIVEFIGEILPVVLVLALVVWLAMLVFRWLGRRRKSRASAVTPKPAGQG